MTYEELVEKERLRQQSELSQGQVGSASSATNPTATKDNSTQGRLEDYMRGAPAGSQTTIGGEGGLNAEGQLQGLERGKALYGQNMAQTGENIQDIVRRRREALDSKSPAGSRIKESANRQIAGARAAAGSSGRNLNAGEESQIRRAGEADASDALFKKERQSLDDYQKLIGNIASGQQSLELGYAGLAESGKYEIAEQQPTLFDKLFSNEDDNLLQRGARAWGTLGASEVYSGF